MLTAYQTAVQNLIQAPSSLVALISSAQLTTYINTARQQLAADAECVRDIATLNTVIGTKSYGFSAATYSTGVQSAISIQNCFISGSANPIEMRPWPWFFQYYFRSSTTGTPSIAAQFGQGLDGSLNLYPIPNAVVALELDSVCIPINLVDDTTTEVIPYAWTDAVPFYASWLALLSLQRPADADEMFARYKELSHRERQFATPEVLPSNYQGGVGAVIASTKSTLTGMSAAQASPPGR